LPRNGSGVFTPTNNFVTEAAAAPIEIAKLDTTLVDIGDAISASLASDGQTNPTANIKLNGFRLINLGAATALTDAPRVTELIDQDHIYYVDSGSANTYAITPSPAIAAYEEGQRFVFRAANANSGASTLNVNALGAIAIQTVDAGALASGAIVAGGIYEVTYDANTSPDRWVLTSMPSDIPDGMLSSNVPLKNAINVFTGTANDFTAGAGVRAALRVAGNGNTAGTTSFDVFQETDSDGYLAQRANAAMHFATNGVTRLSIGDGGNYDFKAGTVTTSNSSAAEVGYRGTPQNIQNGSYSLVITDAGWTIYKASGGAGETITIPANTSVAFPPGTIIRIVNNGGGSLTIAITDDTLSVAGAGTTGSRTLSDHGVAVLEKVAATEWFISGIGLT
jgi:hypothetical protein